MLPDFPIVDPHQHFWDLERNYHPWLCDPTPPPFRYGDTRPLRRTYLPPDYRADAGAVAVARTVYVEAEWDPRDPLGEVRWVEGIAARYGLPSACVAQAWLDHPDVEQVLAAHAASPLVRGIRHKPRAAQRPEQARRGAPGSMDDPAWRRGYALLERHGLSFDLQTPWWHLDAAAALARDFPRTAIILNHAGLPAERSAAGLAGWRRALEQIADCPNVSLKISGLGQPGLPWTLEANGPVIQDALRIFGAARCMFASNYPVDKLAGPFPTIYHGFTAAVAERPLAERRALFHDNAVRIYRL
ncbi:MAG TPA: amidohydrolase family protein [bacterium]|nr:amidohydrolase family protein [bacterium]